MGELVMVDPNAPRKVCDVCRESEEAVLTKHHYTRREKHILKLKTKRAWTYRCANCHMAFNKLGVMKFYEPGGYWDTHFRVNIPESDPAPGNEQVK